MKTESKSFFRNLYLLGFITLLFFFTGFTKFFIEAIAVRLVIDKISMSAGRLIT